MLSGNFAEMTISTPFRDLLHSANLRHGTDGFTSPPKEGVLRIFSPLKIRRLRWSRSSVLAFSTQLRGFKPSRSRQIFKGEKILNTPSKGKKSRRSHVRDLPHVEDP
jgi:hypothetical protein